MIDLNQIVGDADAVREANLRYTETESYQAKLISKYRKYQHWYAPSNDDQWPEDMALRPGKIHMTTNIVKPAVDVEARLQAKLPRLVLHPTDESDEQRARAEVTEKVMLSYLEASGWSVWTQTLCRAKAIYGKGVLKVFWNKDEQRPDVRVVENPANLRIGWGSSDFTEMDWALYEYKLSPLQVMQRWPDVIVPPPKGSEPLVILPRRGGTHADPLGQRAGSEPLPNYMPSDYENRQVLVWDYWYKRVEKGALKVYNCLILQKQVHAIPPTLHPELVDIPYIVIENDHEPGSPEGLSSIGPILDLQIEKNRAMSHWAQYIADELTPAYQIDDDSVPGGIIPKAGEIIPAGDDHKIERIGGQVNTFPVDQLNQALWFDFHRITGLPEIAFGNPSGADVSGRALAVQIDGAANRIEPRRTLLYGGYRELMIFWQEMLERLNPKIDVGGQEIGIGPFVEGLRRWEIVPPEITPRDVIEHTQNTISKHQAGLISAYSAMDELGVDSPQDELNKIATERSNPDLNPGFVQQKMALAAAAQQMQIQQAQLEAQVPTASGAALQTAQDSSGATFNLAQQQQASPRRFEDQNTPIPPTGEGSPPPPGAPPPSLTQTTLARSNAQGQPITLNQIALNRQL